MARWIATPPFTLGPSFKSADDRRLILARHEEPDLPRHSLLLSAKVCGPGRVRVTNRSGASAQVGGRALLNLRRAVEGQRDPKSFDPVWVAQGK